MDKTIINFHYKNGLQFNFPENRKLIIDGTSSKVSLKAKSIVSHAHSDHFSIMNSSIDTFATQQTIELYLCQKNISEKKNLYPKDWDEKFSLTFGQKETEITFISSGHILGSSSILVEIDGKSLLFSSDIGGKGLLSIEKPLETRSADILIVEATFGSPELHFRPREEISMDILKWSTKVINEKRNVVLSAGKIGSAQELIKLFNNFTNLRVITHDDVTPICDVYKKHGIKLDYIDSKTDEGREIINDGECIIIQSRSKKIVPYFMKEKVDARTAIVTGMASLYRYKDFDNSFPLSSHANYNEIIEYINEISPELVFTIYGYDKRLAKAITKELNIPSIPLKEKVIPDSNEKISDINYYKQKAKIKQPMKTKDFPIEKESVVKEDLKKRKTLDDFFKKD
ncbi:MAG: hypothetical protein FK730_01450 [Asgard group archaeon]|nr:hypothetical protein [Asgard group archaeon]